MYYVVPREISLFDCGKGHHPEAIPFHTAREAMQEADALHAKYGNHWHVVATETIWTTTTLADLMAERKA